jgi:hypothetical protein
MTAVEALALIDQIASTGNRAEKQAYLGTLAATELGKFILNQTYNPFITYGIKLKTRPEGAGVIDLGDDSVADLLKRLASRELTGNAAKDELQGAFNALDEASAELLFRIICKDLKAGIAESTIASVVPNLLPSYSVMRAHTFEKKRVQDGELVYGEPKLDGYRCTFICKQGQAAFFTRSGDAMPALQHLAKPLMDAAQAFVDKYFSHEKFGPIADVLMDNGDELAFVIDTEAMTGLFETAGAMRRKNEEAKVELHVFDLLPYSGFIQKDEYAVPYKVRKTQVTLFATAVRTMSDFPLFETEWVELRSHEAIDAYYDSCVNRSIANYLARGDAEREKVLAEDLIDKQTGEPKVLEGAIIKLENAGYAKGKSYTWLKMKPEETEDLFITGFFNGDPTSKYGDIMGGAIVDHKGVEVRVGGGWSDKERNQLWEDWCHDAKILGVDPHVGFKPGKSWPLDHLRAGEFKFLMRMIEVKFHEVTPDGSLRHPRKIKFRDDKAGEARRELKAAA